MDLTRTRENTGTTAVKPGFELPLAALEDWLQSNVRNFSGPVNIQQFRGGQSNPTYLLYTPNYRYVLRKKPAGKLLKTAHAVDREYRIIRALQDTEVPVPQAFAYCEDESVIGTSFYVMEYLEGRIFWDLIVDDCSPTDRREQWFAAVTTLANLHNLDHHALELEDFGKPGNYYVRQFKRWSRQYLESRDCLYNPSMDKLLEWIPNRIPLEESTAIVHGDYQFSNIVFANHVNRVEAILDWELSTLGHPLSDIAYFCRVYHLPFEHGGILDVNKTLQGIPSESELVAEYCRQTGIQAVQNWEFYVVFGMFRLAAIRQGVARRVNEGTAKSPHAKKTGAKAIPVAEHAWRLAQLSS